MAIITNNIYRAENGLFTISYDYDDVSLRIDSFTIANNGSFDYTISVTSTSSGKNYLFDAPIGTNTTQNVPPGAQNRLDITITESGKIDGVEWQVF